MIDAAETAHAGPTPSARLEFALVAALAAAFLAVCLATCSRFPIVWVDEVYFTEPAVNANLGLGFTSYANAVQPHGRYWAGNTPLYSMLLAGWLKVFGIGLVQVRSFGYMLAALAVVVLWWAAVRLALIGSARMRLAFVLTLLLAYGPGVCYRGARYDTLSILLASLTLLAASVRPARWRLAALTALGALFTLTQLALVVCAAEVGLLLLVFYRGKHFREVAAVAIGTIGGGALLYALFQAHGVWPDFVTFLRHQKEIKEGGTPKDPSFPLVFAAACCIAADRYRRGAFRGTSVLAFGLAAGILVPAGQLALGWYPTYYTWMAILPLAAGIFAEWSRAGNELSIAARTMAALALAGSCLVGMPFQVASALQFWNARDYLRVVSIVRGNVGGDDWVYCDPAAYYAVKTTAGSVFLTCYDKADRLFTPEEKRRISIMVIPPWQLEQQRARVGGQWLPVGEPIRPPDRGLWPFRRRFGDKLVANYELQLYRRRSDAPRD